VLTSEEAVTDANEQLIIEPKQTDNQVTHFVFCERLSARNCQSADNAAVKQQPLLNLNLGSDIDD
jgi:hypothetical protein